MATITELPTVNYDSYPGYDEFKFLHSTYSYEFKTRSGIASEYGIVDTSYDPASAPFTSGRPLLVTVSPINPLTIDIAAGFAITPSHLLIAIDAIVPSVPLPSLTAGNTYVVAVEYTLVASPQQRVNRFGDLTDVRLERPANIPPGGGASTLINAITVANINDYNNPAIFSDERKQNVVVIAIVSSQSDTTTGQIYLTIDLTRNSYAFNRSWYTVRDVEHRSKVGSGVITDTNPHGVALQDLSTEGLTLYQQLKPRGGILAKDVSYYGYAGKICSEEITLSRWESDTTGMLTTPTGMQPIGGRYFVRLSKLPIRTGSLYFTGKPWQPIPYTWIEGTRILVLGTLENPATYTGTLVAEYFTVDALEIGAESPTQGLQTIEVKSPVPNQEIIISGGLAIGELAQTSLSLPSVLGPIKKGYQVVCDSTGSLALCPQPILASVKVVDLVGTTRTVNQATLSGSAVYLTLGLTRAIERTILNPTTSYDLNLKIQIVGVDGNGTSRVETITFLGSQWKDQVPTVNEEQPLQFLRTYYKYQLINSIALANTLSEPHNAGPDAAISMWADALSGVDNQEFASVASFFWTGSTGIRVKDERLIATSFDKLDQKKSRFPTELPDANFSTVQELYSVILNPPLTNPATPAKRLMLELDDDRVWADTWKEFSTAWASGAITVADVTFITMGQTIRIAQNKYLSVVQSGANPSLGEVNYSTSGDIFRNNIIVTINDPTWDSSWYASLGQGTNPPISLTRELAYPEGFAVNTRLRIIFSSPFTAGSFQLTINSVVIGPVAFDTDNVTTLNKIKTEINNAATLTGGVTAVVEGTTGLILNGHPDGHPFECLQSDFVSSGGAPAASTQTPLTAFTVTQPSNGILPTAHLPQRYPSSLTTWEYLSRPFLWEGVWLEGTIAVSGDNPALIGDFDAIEIAPSKVIFARVGSGATADPTIGQYLVDAGSIGNTLANLAATVNHPLFASGVSASVVGTTVVLRSSGMASTTLRILASVVPNTWILSSVGGNTQYVPTGAGSGYGLIKALKPLEAADWRYVTVEEVAAGWTLWMPLISLSQTSYLFEAPAGKSFYQIQFRLRGGISNSFALYSYVPETSSATLTAIDSRLTAVEDIIDDADGNCSSLAVRLSNIVDLDGVPIQDTELTNARASVILPTQAVLKDRLDIMDTRLYFTSAGGVTPHGVVTEAHAGLPPQLIAGPLDINGNSNFINAVGLTVYAGGSISDPLLTQINGFTYRYERQIPFTFVGGGTPSPAVGNYYVYLTESTAWGYELTDGTCDLAEGDTSIVDLAANFVADEVDVGHLVVFPTLTLGGEPLVFSIVGVFATSVTISGTVPLNASMVTYKVYNPKEGIIQIHSGSKVISTDRLYLGEINWTGSAVNVLSYRYLNSYSSPVVRVDASTGSYETSFAHNLGFYPKSFTIYFWEEVAGVPSGDPKVLHLGDEAVVKTTKYSMTVKSRMSYLVARTYGGFVKDVGYLQLVI